MKKTQQEQRVYSHVQNFIVMYFLLFVAFIMLLGVILGGILSEKKSPSLRAKYTSKAVRGAIITADGFHVAKSQKLYKVVVNTRYIDPNKEELFVALFSIYSNIEKKIIAKKVHSKKGVVVLSYNIPQKEAKYLKQLAHEFRRYRVFRSLKNPKTGISMVQGLSIIESGESRIYPYKTTLTPLIGYPHKIEENGYTMSYGVKGLEKRFEEELQAKNSGVISGERDVNGYIILNKKSYTKEAVNGLDLLLYINLSLQIRIEKILDAAKKRLDAKEVFMGILDSKNGKVLALASSNRYSPKKIFKKDYNSLNTSAIEFSFEPGSVIKPLTFSILLEHKLLNPYEIVNGHKGRFKIGRKVITDEHRFSWLSAEDVIVHSSNVGIAQLAQRLDGTTFYNGLKQFDLGNKSTPDLIYERTGSLPKAYKLNHEIYKATTSYGYGMRVNLMQLLRAYSAFNNNGLMVTPTIVSAFVDEHAKKILLEPREPQRAITSATAKRMKKILIKTVLKGTGQKTITKGLVIGGKTGTAHLVEKGIYVKKYNTSFLGFANDKNHRYTMGVVVRQPKTNHFASQTAVPVFKEVVDLLVEEGYLHPKVQP